MTIEPLTELLTVISNMSPGSAPAWNPGMEKVYEIGLRSVPDQASPLLAEAVVDTCTFRPSVHELLDVWKRISSPTAQVSPSDVVAALSVKVQKYGAYGQPHPTLRNTRVLGPPPDMSSQELAVVACWGGWENYANDDSPVGVKRGQALKIADMGVNGGESDDINRLRLEYQAMRASLPPPMLMIETGGIETGGIETGGIETGGDTDAPPVQEARTDTKMERIGARLPRMTTRGE